MKTIKLIFATTLLLPAISLATIKGFDCNLGNEQVRIAFVHDTPEVEVRRIVSNTNGTVYPTYNSYATSMRTSFSRNGADSRYYFTGGYFGRETLTIRFNGKFASIIDNKHNESKVSCAVLSEDDAKNYRSW